MVWHLQNAAKRNRQYEKKSDMVIIMVKQNKFDKSHKPVWSCETYKVIGIDDNNFLLNHPTKQMSF